MSRSLCVTEPSQSLSNSPDKHAHTLFKVPTVIRKRVKRRIIPPHVSNPLLPNTPLPAPPPSSLLQSISMEVVNSSPESSGNQCQSSEPASSETTTHKPCDVHVSPFSPLVTKTRNFAHLTKSARVKRLQQVGCFPKDSLSHEKNRIHQHKITSFIQRNRASPKQLPQSSTKGRYTHNACFYIHTVHMQCSQLRHLKMQLCVFPSVSGL